MQRGKKETSNNSEITAVLVMRYTQNSIVTATQRHISHTTTTDYNTIPSLSPNKISASGGTFLTASTPFPHKHVLTQIDYATGTTTIKTLRPK